MIVLRTLVRAPCLTESPGTRQLREWAVASGAAFGFTEFTNYRIRILLYGGKPNWNLLPTITPG